MLTDLQTRKLTKLFSMYDADFNGGIFRADLENIAKKLAHRRNWSLRSPRYITLANQFAYDWKCLKRDADSTHDQQVSIGEWLEYYRAVLDSPEHYQQSIKTLMTLVFDAFDADDDGKICESEWGDFLSIYNVSPVYAPLVFPLLDPNKNGFLTKADLLTLLDDFFYSDNPNAVANFMFGPY